jgi:hypothetical protein
VIAAGTELDAAFPAMVDKEIEAVMSKHVELLKEMAPDQHGHSRFPGLLRGGAQRR